MNPANLHLFIEVDKAFRVIPGGKAGAGHIVITEPNRLRRPRSSLIHLAVWTWDMREGCLRPSGALGSGINRSTRGSGAARELVRDQEAGTDQTSSRQSWNL